MKRSSWKDEYLYSVRLFKKRRRLLVFLVQAFSIIISFTATTNVKTVLAEEKLDRHNKSGLIEFIQPEYDGIIVDTNSSMQFVISTNYNHIIETFKVCFRLLVTKEDDVNHQTSTKTECKNFTVDNNTGRFTVIFNRKMHESSIVIGVANVLPKVRLTGAPHHHSSNTLVRTLFVSMEKFGGNLFRSITNTASDYLDDSQGLVPLATAAAFNMKVLFMARTNTLKRKNNIVTGTNTFLIKFLDPVKYSTVTDHYMKISVKLLKNSMPIKNGLIKLRLYKRRAGSDQIGKPKSNGNVLFQIDVKNNTLDSEGVIALQYWQTSAQLKSQQNILIFTIEYYNYENSGQNNGLIVFDQTIISNIMWNEKIETSCNIHYIQDNEQQQSKSFSFVETALQKRKYAFATFILSENHYLHGVIALSQSIFKFYPNAKLIVLAPQNSLSVTTISLLSNLNIVIKFVEEINYGKTFYRYPSNIWTRLQYWNMVEYDYIIPLDADSVLLKRVSYLFDGIALPKDGSLPMSHMCPMKTLSENTMTMPCCTSSFITLIRPSRKVFNVLKTWAKIHNRYIFAEFQFLNAYFYKKHVRNLHSRYYCNREHMSFKNILDSCTVYDFTNGPSKNTKKIWLYSKTEKNDLFSSKRNDEVWIKNLHTINNIWFELYSGGLKRMKQAALEKGSVDNTSFFTDLPDCNIVPECRDYVRNP